MTDEKFRRSIRAAEEALKCIGCPLLVGEFEQERSAEVKAKACKLMRDSGDDRCPKEVER